MPINGHTSGDVELAHSGQDWSWVWVLSLEHYSFDIPQWLLPVPEEWGLGSVQCCLTNLCFQQSLQWSQRRGISVVSVQPLSWGVPVCTWALEVGLSQHLCPSLSWQLCVCGWPTVRGPCPFPSGSIGSRYSLLHPTWFPALNPSVRGFLLSPSTSRNRSLPVSWR